MKSFILKSITPLFVISMLVFTSCNKEEDPPLVEVPSVEYSTTTYDGIFYQAGNSVTPSISWNGNIGSISLTTTISGLTINNTTGVVSWTENFPPGIHEIEIVVSNSAGQSTAYLIVNNRLHGTFTGTYDNLYFFEIEFNQNGTILLLAEDGENNEYTGTGNWAIDGPTISIDYTYDELLTEFSLSGTISIGTGVLYSGTWYNGHGAIPGNEGGVFEVGLN